ncbi:hypothetical protein ACE1SV_64220 [Streptomyces sp. E-15]
MTAPLSRSLDPLPGESLAGFLLRLSFRLGLTPAALIRRTGLADVLSTGQVYARTALGIALAPELAADFSAATRLSLDEVRALTVEPLAPRLPAVRDAVLFPRPKRDWLFPTTVRYCPHCLAGDGSPIQQEYGGPWNVLWRLPDVFACTRHRCFLEHLCPICRQPIVEGDLSQLIPRGTIAGLHPAQCRAPSPRPITPKERATAAAVCGWRLDQRTPPADWDRPAPEHLALQQRILDRLAPHSPAQDSARYFAELILTSALVIATWPLGSPPGRHRTAQTATTVLAERRRLEATRTQSSNAPPIDARACAAVLLAAETILNAPDLREALAPLAPPTGHGTKKPRFYYGWDALFKGSRHECSPTFQLAVDTVMSKGRRVSRGGPLAAHPGTEFREEHVPAFLHDEWAALHLDDFRGISLRQLRRGAAVRLARRARGGSIIDAAQFLGVSSGFHVRFNNFLMHRLKDKALMLKFEADLDNLAIELSRHPIDYAHRRRALDEGAIPPEVWEAEIARPGLTHGCKFAADDRKRLACSAYVWARVTHGEHLFAPTPAEIRDDSDRKTVWRRDATTVFSLLKRARNYPRYLMLKEELDAYAYRLADSLDCQRSTGQEQRSLAK